MEVVTGQMVIERRAGESCAAEVVLPAPREPAEPSRGAEVAGESDAELVDRIREAEQTMRRALHGQLLRIAEAERRGLPGASGMRSVQHWLRDMLNLAVGDARDRVQVARQITPDTGLDGAPVPPAAPGTAEALRDGEITLAHAGAIVDGLAALPPGVDAAERGELESALTRQARELPPHELRDSAERLRYALDQEGALRTEEHQIDQRALRLGTGRDGMTVLSGRLDRETGAKLRAALAPLAGPRREPGGAPDTRSPAKRNADALAELLDGGAQGAGRPHLAVTVDFDQLVSAVGATGAFGCANKVGGTLDDTGRAISAATARRLACDAKVLPIVLGGDGQPLDVGRAERTAPPQVRAALRARDGSCAFPDCDRPPGTAQAHHIRHWADGGETALHNMVMLCAHHHRVVHLHRWEVRMDDGRPVFVPPERVDPQRRPRAGGSAARRRRPPAAAESE